MTQAEVIQEFEVLFRDILDEDDLHLTANTTAHDVENWDSLTHIQLIVAIEKKYKIKFSSKEIVTWKNVGEMADAVISKKQ